MKVLDSDFLIALLRKDPDIPSKLRELLTSDEKVTTTIFNAHEVLFGARLTNHPRNIEKTQRLLNSLDTLTYDSEAMHHAVEIIALLQEKGERIGIFDELVSGICIANSATIVTRNVKHFSRVPGLKLEKW
ncbi:type II toxin-antitoxin system VapC family toxin [Candidatus Woesearchaeota archaeon]|nr:type II toxin-antitoxin system VapC family toxin [Candidatus Woesearchaeota archaeon]